MSRAGSVRLSRNRWALIWAAVLAAAAAACTTGGPTGSESTAVPTNPAGGQTATTEATAAEATETVTATAPPVATASGRASGTPVTDGLTGAPVPPPQAPSAEVDLSRSNGAGNFPPLTDPVAIPAPEATWLDGDDLVLGAIRNGEARAYPLSMMTFHHVVNDRLGGQPYLVTF